jgi:NADPH-dependent curcumin reductase CurA
VGSAVGQIAKLGGCRAVGIARGADKCRYLVDCLGFNACVDHRAADLPAQLAATCSKGIDAYFESVGGAVFDAIMPVFNVGARIPVCGMIAGSNRQGVLMGTLLCKLIAMRGFITFKDYRPRFGEFFAQMDTWVQDGQIRYREDIVDGLGNAPQAFIELLEGRNFGKLIVKVAEA